MKHSSSTLEDVILAIPQDTVTSAWFSVDEKQRYIIEERVSGKTLQSLGDEFNLTRERIRQLQQKGSKAFLKKLRFEWHGWERWSGDLSREFRAIDIMRVIDSFPKPDLAKAFIPIIFNNLGWEPHSRDAVWWLQDKRAVARLVEDLCFDEPVPVSEWEVYQDESGFPSDFVAHLVAEGTLKICEYDGYIIGTRHRKLHKAYIYLLEHGPSSAENVAHAVGETNARNFEEFLRRQERFAKDFAERKWDLSENVHVKFRNATTALLNLLSSHGPMTKREIAAGMADAYPVSASRIQQCLTDYRIGTMPDGRFYLIERGAHKEPEPEPSQPSHMHCSGSIVGIRKQLDHNVMRGSGLVEHKWLAWKLGLHSTPMKTTFSSRSGLPDYTVTRAGDNCQLSSLRAVALAKNLKEGCSVVIILDTDRFMWDLKHVCDNCRAN